jgi:hypothetical protein
MKPTVTSTISEMGCCPILSLAMPLLLPPSDNHTCVASALAVTASRRALGVSA